MCRHSSRDRKSRTSQATVWNTAKVSVPTSSAVMARRPRRARGTCRGRGAWRGSGSRRSAGWPRDGTGRRSRRRCRATGSSPGRSAGCCACRGSRSTWPRLAAQLRDLAVEGVEEGLRLLLVAAAALADHLGCGSRAGRGARWCARCGSPRRSAGARRLSASPVAWMLVANVSSMPWWHVPQVSARLAGWTVERGSSGGSSPCDVWQLTQVAVTTRPLSVSPWPWIESA